MPGTEFKNQVDNLMNILFGAGVASHATIIEQINYLIFLRSLSKKDDNAMILDSSSVKIFSGELAKYHWDNLLVLNAEVLFTTLEEIFRKLPELATDQTIRLLFRDAHVKIFDKPTLRRLVHEIEKMMSELEKEASLGHTDIFGDMYEYLLSKISQAGTLGQFRTPRHIIKFIVDVIDPNKGETILDPACGTAGFLVSALEHLKEKYTSDELKKEGRFVMNKLSKEERDFVYQHTFTGFDSDSDMFKFGLMNLYLHKLEHPNIKRQNTLVDTAGDRTKWDIVLANPPFAGALDQESVSEDIKMGTKSTEVLFLRFINDHLAKDGKAGIIVPDGIITRGGAAYGKLRKLLVETGLWSVVDLPAGVFQPYSKVKTSIIFIDKTLNIPYIIFSKIKPATELTSFEISQETPLNIDSIYQSILKAKKKDFEHENELTLLNKDIILESKDAFLKSEYYKDSSVTIEPGKIILGDILERSGEKVGNKQNIPVMSITMEFGLIDQAKKFKKRIANTDISKYKLVKRGELVVGFPIDEGVLGFQTQYDYAAVSPAYDIWRVKNNGFPTKYLEYVLRSPQAIQLYKLSMKGTANRRRVVPKDVFLSLEIPAPDKNTIDTINKNIIGIEEQNTNLKKQVGDNLLKIEKMILDVWK